MQTHHGSQTLGASIPHSQLPKSKGLGLVNIRSHTGTHKLNSFLQSIYRRICVWQHEQCFGYSPSLIPLGYCDLDGAIYNPKGVLRHVSAGCR